MEKKYVSVVVKYSSQTGTWKEKTFNVEKGRLCGEFLDIEVLTSNLISQRKNTTTKLVLVSPDLDRSSPILDPITLHISPTRIKPEKDENHISTPRITKRERALQNELDEAKKKIKLLEDQGMLKN